jgi:hypothetical protein
MLTPGSTKCPSCDEKNPYEFPPDKLSTKEELIGRKKFFSSQKNLRALEK